MTPEFHTESAVLDQLGGAAAFQPPRHDVEGRRAFWEPILAASGFAQPFPDDVETSDRYATAANGAEIRMRWYTKADTRPGSAVVYFHGAAATSSATSSASTGPSPGTSPPAVCRCCRSNTDKGFGTRQAAESRAGQHKYRDIQLAVAHLHGMLESLRKAARRS
jgi:hypothetical protein